MELRLTDAGTLLSISLLLHMTKPKSNCPRSHGQNSVLRTPQMREQSALTQCQTPASTARPTQPSTSVRPTTAQSIRRLTVNSVVVNKSFADLGITLWRDFKDHSEKPSFHCQDSTRPREVEELIPPRHSPLRLTSETEYHDQLRGQQVCD